MNDDARLDDEQPHALSAIPAAPLAVSPPAPLERAPATDAPVAAEAPPPAPVTTPANAEAAAREKQAQNEERRKQAQATWERLVEARSAGTTVEGAVRTQVKGGLLVDIHGYRGFLPASQSGLAKGAALDGLVGKTLPLKVLDIDETRKRVVVSHRRAQQDERRAARTQLLQSLKVGEQRDVTVVRLADFGAFVDLGSGIDALIPASELAFERVEKPGDVVKVGEQLRVKVLRIDEGGKKIAVSRKGALADPWRDHARILQRGNTVEGKVVGKERGLEVEIAPGIVGSVSDRDANPDEYEIGESLEVTIRSADFRARRVRLSTAHAAAATFSSSNSFAPLGAELKIPTSDES